MWDFFNTKPLSEYTDDEIREKLSFVSIGINQNDVNNLMNEATKRGINVRILDIGSSNFKGEESTGKSNFSKCFKDEPKRKLITLVGNKRKKLVKSKYKKKLVESKYFIPNLTKKIQKCKSKKYTEIFDVKYPDIDFEETIKQGKDVWVVLPNEICNKEI